MSFFKKLFGGSGATRAEETRPTAQEDYKGFTITAEPYAAEGQYQVAGSITKDVDGTRKKHQFVRADRFATVEDASQVSLLKGRQMIDQMGDGVFR